MADDFFKDDAEAHGLYTAEQRTLGEIGAVETKASKSQIAFRRKRAFAWVWRPRQHLGKGAPLVLSVALKRRSRSKRWKKSSSLRRRVSCTTSS